MFGVELNSLRFYPAPPPDATHVCYFNYAAWYTPTYHRTVVRRHYPHSIYSNDGLPYDYDVNQTFFKDVPRDWVDWYGGKGRWIDNNNRLARSFDRIPRVPFVGAWWQKACTHLASGCSIAKYGPC